ncbi:MAG: hypothetical protein M1816_001484 [Peltula sp. TS41687]|nr:MAG: hypothetical protein M1816_001484 [Peltula sp. TS41687]
MPEFKHAQASSLNSQAVRRGLRPKHPPISYGMILFPGFQVLDVFGPLSALEILSKDREMNLYMVAATMKPVSTAYEAETNHAKGSNFAQTVLPTHTLADCPGLDVLIVPGGLGTRASDIILSPILDFITARYPLLQYLITVCTGSGLVARAGILDGRKATTNKAAWSQIVAWRPCVQWIPEARWVVDGNIWTSAGVSAGIDVTLAFIATVYGDESAQKVADSMEYERHLDPSDDPFAKLIH